MDKHIFRITLAAIIAVVIFSMGTHTARACGEELPIAPAAPVVPVIVPVPGNSGLQTCYWVDNLWICSGGQ